MSRPAHQILPLGHHPTSPSFVHIKIQILHDDKFYLQDDDDLAQVAKALLVLCHQFKIVLDFLEMPPTQLQPIHQNKTGFQPQKTPTNSLIKISLVLLGL